MEDARDVGDKIPGQVSPDSGTFVKRPDFYWAGRVL